MEEDHSDADSGVTDLPPWQTHRPPLTLNPGEAKHLIQVRQSS